MSGRSRSKQKRRNARRLKKFVHTLSRKGRKAFSRGEIIGQVLSPKKKPRTSIEILQDANEKMCIVIGVKYEKVMKLREDLKAEGISANITTGGLQIHTNVKNKVVLRLCKKYDTIPEAGVSRFVEAAYLGTMKCQQPQ